MPNGKEVSFLKATDDSSLVGFDYQTVVVATIDGRVISGLVTREDEHSLALQTAKGTVTIAKDKIDERSTSSVSVMSEGVMKDLSNEQVRDLLGYLQGTEQAPLPPEKRE